MTPKSVPLRFWELPLLGDDAASVLGSDYLTKISECASELTFDFDSEIKGNIRPVPIGGISSNDSLVNGIIRAETGLSLGVVRNGTVSIGGDTPMSSAPHMSFSTQVPAVANQGSSVFIFASVGEFRDSHGHLCADHVDYSR